MSWEVVVVGEDLPRATPKNGSQARLLARGLRGEGLQVEVRSVYCAEEHRGRNGRNGQVKKPKAKPVPSPAARRIQFR